MTDRRTTSDIDARLARLEQLADKLDSQFRVPFTEIRFGWDAILGFIPGIGDVAALAPAAYIVAEGRSLGASNATTARMLGNIGIDWLIGLVPVIGDIFDIGFKGNRRNVALLREHLGAPTGEFAPA
ncbi:DUF4112 domain-containing protein [Jannaschia marina]|uniref:DUF4112 domain-containing protein n=1 Tax=Jannaschia marina TaxID=2741674 RepID=UPI0015CC8E7F|nr:DUF4112 domain-containing protein [Jannaschia marina]